jgi:hypothetical protein
MTALPEEYMELFVARFAQYHAVGNIHRSVLGSGSFSARADASDSFSALAKMVGYNK